MERPDFFELKNGEKVKLPFTDKEYNDRVSKLRSMMEQKIYSFKLIWNDQIFLNLKMVKR